jgi:hypothetical protein
MTEDTKTSIYPSGGTPWHVSNCEMRKIEINPKYNRPPRTTVDHQQHDFELCAIDRGSNNQRFHAETSRIL